jgi:hypothetical protein
MADASRFPQLAFPFAIVGAAAGWLSTSFLANPLVHVTRVGKQGLAAFCAMTVAAATGALLTRWCVGKRYAYELAAPNPDALARTDTWPRRIGAVLAGGTASGAVVATLCDAYGGPTAGAVSGFFCSIAFVPVCTAVVASARRAQRARLGSLVAGSDRRAVWGILSTALALATLEALLDWPASAGGEVPVPMPALRMVQAAGLVTLAILVADVIALRRTRRAIASGLEHQNPTEIDAGGEAVPRLDLGLGEDLLARFARSGSAYRGRDRTLALVLGSPEQATSALRRAIRRGAIGLVVIGAVYGGHAAAHMRLARELYEEYRCEQGQVTRCARAAEIVRQHDLEKAIALYERACDGSEAASCTAIAELYERGEGVAADPYRALVFHGRACDAGGTASCRIAVNLLDQRGGEAIDGYRRLALLRRACAGGDQVSCHEGGWSPVQK